MNGCTYTVNPFAMSDEQSECGKEPTSRQYFRNKESGVVQFDERCIDHERDCNDKWEHVTVTPSAEIKFPLGALYRHTSELILMVVGHSFRTNNVEGAICNVMKLADPAICAANNWRTLESLTIGRAPGSWMLTPEHGWERLVFDSGRPTPGT